MSKLRVDSAHKHNFTNEVTSWPADEETGRDLVILINRSVQESLLAVRGSCIPTCCIAAVADLARANTSQWKDKIFTLENNNYTVIDCIILKFQPIYQTFFYV